MDKITVFLFVMVVLMLLMAMLIPIMGIYNLLTTSNIIEEFCEDRGYDSKGSDCYKIHNDKIVRRDVSIIDGEAYFRE